MISFRTMIAKHENIKQGAESPRLLEKHFMCGFFPCRRREASNPPARGLFPGCSPQTKGLLNIVLLASALLAATGCVSLDYARVGSAQQNQVALERMVSRQDYHNASIYLDKIKDESDA